MAGLLPFLLTPKDYELYEMSGKKSEEEEEEPEEETLSMKLNKADTEEKEEVASEDFAKIAERVPSAFLYLSAGFPDERGAYSAHNPKVRFNEEVCPIGAAAYAHCAARWLETTVNKK